MTSLEEKRRVAMAKIQSMVKHKPTEPTSEAVDNPATESSENGDKPVENTLILPSSFNLRPLYSKVDINCDKWLLTLTEEALQKLKAPPSLADSLDANTEAELRFLGCELIQAGAILLRLPQTAAATGQILFQRFYYQRSFVKYMFQHTVMACLLLASKIEEAPRRTRDVYNVFHRLEQLYHYRSRGQPITKDLKANFKVRPLDVTYINVKNHMIKAERRLLATLGFVVHVKHPHKLICSYIFLLNQSDREDLLQKAWSYMNDGLRTDMFVRYTPETIACACIDLAARTVEPPIVLPSTPFNWFEVFDASDRDVQAISLMLMELYARRRPINMKRLVDVLDKMREERELAEKAKQAQLVAEKLSEAKKIADEKSEESLEENSKSHSKSRSRSPRRKSPRRRNDSPNRKRHSGRRDRDDRRDRERDRGRDRDRDRDRDRRRSRSRDRNRNDKDKIKERNRIREREINETLSKRKRREDISPPSKASRK